MVVIERLELTAEKLYTNSIVRVAFPCLHLLLRAVGWHPAKLDQNSRECVLSSFTSPASHLDHWPPKSFLSVVSNVHNTHLGTQIPHPTGGPVLAMDPGTESSQ